MNNLWLKHCRDYNKFDLPFSQGVNYIDVHIEIMDILKINDKVKQLIAYNVCLEKGSKYFGSTVCETIHYLYILCKQKADQKYSKHIV